MHIGYPFFVDEFPDVTSYISYFSTIADYARSKGMVLFVKSAITPNNEVYGAVDPVVLEFMSGKTQEEYLDEKTQMLQTIIDVIEPDYLTVENEPTTMEASSGLAFDFSPASLSSFLTYYIDNLERGDERIGAGAGTWEALEYIEAMSEVEGIDFVDFHVYPVFNDYFSTKLVERCDVVVANGKGVAFGECWLRKMSVVDQFLGLSPAEQAKRDMFSFWQDLDLEFASILSKYSSYYDAEFVTMFQPDRIFAYLDYTAGYEDYTVNQLGQILQPIVFNNLNNFVYTYFAYEFVDLVSDVCGSPCTETNTAMLLQVLANFGCQESDCTGDLLNNGGTNVDDLLYFLTVFGQPC
jgi:hypothetical protein